MENDLNYNQSLGSNYKLPKLGLNGKPFSSSPFNFMNDSDFKLSQSVTKFDPISGANKINPDFKIKSLNTSSFSLNGKPEFSDKSIGSLKSSTLINGGTNGGGFGKAAMSVASGIDPGSITSIENKIMGRQKDAIDTGVDAVSGVAMNLGPWGMLGAGILKGVNLLDKAFGKKTKGANFTVGLSGYTGAGGNFADKQWRWTQRKARKRHERNMDQAGLQFSYAKDNADTNLFQLDARNQAIENTGMTNSTKLRGGNNFSVLTASKGATLEDIRSYIKTRNIKKEVPQNQNLDENIEIQKFQRGGNIIPSGALHKNKHNLETINSDLEGEITKKGIPVISIEDDEKVIQHAEIEKDEVILNLSLTKKLIELMKENTTESQIEAGKILSRELMENTVDNSGITEKIFENEN